MKYILIILFFSSLQFIEWASLPNEKPIKATYTLNYKPSKSRTYRSTGLADLYVTESSSIFIDDKMGQRLFLAKMPSGEEKAGKLMAIGSPAFRYIIRKDKRSEKYAFMEDYLKGEYLAYEEPLIQKWDITSDTAIYSGLLSYKATCRFGGRNWVAWYAPEISVPEGPYKFYGLPGLIVKLDSEDGDYSFTLQSLNRVDKLPDLPKYQLVSHNRYKEMMESITSIDKMESMGHTIGSVKRNGKVITIEEEKLHEKEARKDINTIEID